MSKMKVNPKCGPICKKVNERSSSRPLVRSGVSGDLSQKLFALLTKKEEAIVDLTAAVSSVDLPREEMEEFPGLKSGIYRIWYGFSTT